MIDLYDDDIALWSESQAAMLRRRAVGDVVNDAGPDWANIAHEIEGLARSDRRELRNRIAIVLEHLIKLPSGPATEPRAGWRKTIREQRRGIQTLPRESPSLQPMAPDFMDDEMASAREEAFAATPESSEQPLVDPGLLNFTPDQVLGSRLPGGQA